MEGELISPSLIKVGVVANDWKSAIRAAGSLLLAGGHITERYIDRMLESIDEFGPYIMLDDGIALAHARPEDGALSLGVSLAILAEPVYLPDEERPVRLMFALSAPDNDSHLGIISRLATLMSQDGFVDELASCETPEQAAACLRR